MINNIDFVFGNNPEQYPINGIITDSVFRICTVAGIGFDNQLYTSGFTQGNGYLDYSNNFTPISGQIAKIFFQYPLIMENA